MLICPHSSLLYPPPPKNHLNSRIRTSRSSRPRPESASQFPPLAGPKSGRLRESHFDARALARGRVHRDFRRVQDGGVLDDREPQTGTPGLSRMGLIHPVKSLKHALLILVRNPDTRVGHDQLGPAQMRPRPNVHLAALAIVLDRVVYQVIHHLTQERLHPGERRVRAGEGQLHIERRGARLQPLHHRAAQIKQLDLPASDGRPPSSSRDSSIMSPIRSSSREDSW